MKKLFFFRSSSNNGNKSVHPPLSDKEVYWEDSLDSGVKTQAGYKAENSFRSPRGLFSKTRKQISDSQSSNACSGLRRSRSLSSAAFFSDALGQGNFSSSSDRSRSPSSSTSSALYQQRTHSSRLRAATPDRQSRRKQLEEVAIQNAHGFERPSSSGSSRSHHDMSGSSSFCLSNVSSKVLDRYIDGEQLEETSRQDNRSSQRNHNGIGKGGGRLPPRVQYTAPASRDSIKDKPRAYSFREAKGSSLHLSARDWVENGFGHESPQRLAKNVIKRLSQTHVFPESSSKEFDHDIPITIEDIYGGSLNRCNNSNLDVTAPESYPLDEPVENECHRVDLSDFRKGNYFHSEGLNSIETEDVDVELQRRLRKAEERVILLSDELEQESVLRETGFDVSGLVQTIRNLLREKISLAVEVSDLVQSRIAERALAKEDLKLAKVELESRTLRLEKEKIELQSGLEKELDRRSSDWSLKLERYQSEEHQLRDRVRELAELNVSLQREVRSFNEKETERCSIITHSEQQLKALNTRVENLSKKNEELRKNLSDSQEKYEASEQDLCCIKRNFEEKEKECKELQKSVARLLRTCSEQEKTIEGLRRLGEEMGNKHSLEKLDKHLEKLQMEQMRLTGVELALRKEVESCWLEIDSLRHENISLLNRMKDNGKENGALTFKLDKEMWTRICCLQNQGLSMLNDSAQLCSKLLEFVKVKASQIPDTKQGIEVIKNGLDAQFVVESDMKVQSFKRGTESLTRSLQTMSALLHEKSSPVSLKSQSPVMDAGRLESSNDQTPEETMKTELKAESLLTSLLREKLYSKELEVEQLQAELATAVRGNDILRCEVQNAMDNISFLTHKLKELELQMLKKDENICRLKNELEEVTKDLTIMRGILPKVSEERDVMWEEVKRHKEENMLLNSEVNALKTKIEGLHEDNLLKDGQITILKDALSDQPF